MLRGVDGWEGEHFAFGEAEASTTALPTSVAVDHGAGGPTATIPDAHLLFTAQFARSGTDLVLHGEDGKAFVVRDYFATDDHARLLSPEGAALSADIVAALVGPQAPGQYAQAGAPAAAQAVGRIAQADSDATIVRNGVAVAAHAGDAVLKGDVLQTVSGTVGVTFNDGSTLNLTANTRMVVNEFVYDPKGGANSQLLDLVQGSLTFISGEVAHNGNMNIRTPVATMGIRGTVGGVTTANDGTVRFYVSQSATGAVILDSRGTIIANVVQDGPMIIVRPAGPLQVLAEEVQKTPAQMALELAALQQILNIKAIGDQILQQNQTPDPNAPNPNPQSTDKPLTQFQTYEITLKPNSTDTGNHDSNTQVFTSATVTNTTPNSDGSPPTHTDVPIPPHVNVAPVLDFFNVAVTEGGIKVLSINDFHVTDPDSSSFVFTVSNVTGGTFQVLQPGAALHSAFGFSAFAETNEHWVDATSFTADDIAAGHVRFVTDGGNAAPAFSIAVSDYLSESVSTSAVVTFTPVDNPPEVFVVVQNEGGATVTENAELVFSTEGSQSISVSDSDSATLTVTLTTTHGTVLLNLESEPDVTITSGGQGEATVTFTGSQAAINAALNGLKFVPATDYSGQATLLVETSDGNTTTSENVDIAVSEVNHAPVITWGASNGAEQIQQDTSTGLMLDDTGGLRGIATDGHFLYVDDNGVEIDIYSLAGSYVESHAVDNLTSGQNQMTFADGHLYARYFDSIYIISTQDWSSTAVSIPEDHGLLSAKEWMVGDMLSLPDGRVGVLGANEDGTTTVRLYTVGTDGLSFSWSEDVILQTDGAPGDNHGSASDGTYIYILDNSATSYRVYSLATGELVYDATESVDLQHPGSGVDLSNPTFITHDHVNGEYIVGAYDSAAVLVSGGAGSNVFVAENTTAVTTITATDADADTTLTYSIAGGADSALFHIDAHTGALSFIAAPDYEAPADQGGDNIYDVTVQVSDGALTDTKAFTVTVTNADDGPATPQPAFASVSEEGLPHGIADQTGDGDSTDSATATGTVEIFGGGSGGQLTFKLGLPAAALSSGGHPIIWSLDDYGTLAGKAGVETVITVSINGNGEYTVTLLGPVDHPDTSVEDVKSFDIPVNVSDGETTSSSTLTVNIEDDSPVAVAQTETVVPGVPAISVNIVIVLDVSGSMDTIVSGNETRLSLAKEALANLLHTQNADVNQVMVVSFSAGADVYPATGNHWTDANSANTYIQGLHSNGGTNYDDAVSKVIASWGNGPTTADKTLVYFISDGAPTAGHGLTTGVNGETAAWETFLSDKGVSVANAIGISTSVNNPELAKIAWAPGNADLSPIVLTQATDLNGTLQGTVPTTTHNIFDTEAVIGFGADGGRIYSIAVDGVTYTWDGAGHIFKSNDESHPLTGSSISVTTQLGGTFKFAFSTDGGHEAGDWSYTPSANANVNGIETFHYVLSDYDGDHAAADITVVVDGIGNIAPILANVAPTASYTENGADAVLSPNLTVSDADSLMLAGASVKIAAGHVDGDLLYTDTSGTNISASFDGTVLRLSGSDTAAHYQQVLDAVRFASYSDDPTDGGVSPSRTLDWQVGSSFEAQTNFAAGSSIYAMTAGDVNGDGKTDLVVSNVSDQAVSVLLGNGDGTFQSPVSFSAGGYATGTTIADINGDGKADVVVSNFYNNTVSVLLGEGDGTFQAPLTQSVGNYAYAVAAADLDGDGNTDIASANYYNNTISVLFGNGDGTFRDQTNYGVGYNPQFIAIADLNADGNLDLITANAGQSTVSVLLGRSDGTFQNSVDFTTGSGPRSLLIADLNSDGKLDLVTADSSGSTVSVLFGAGDGTFGSPTEYGVANNPTSVLLGDVNTDGKMDLVVVTGGNTASVLLGNGDGTFQSQTTTDVIGNGAVAGALLDLNGDGRPDLITANSGQNTVSVLLGNDSNLSAVQHSTIDITAVNDAPVNGLPFSVGVAGLAVIGSFTLDQYLALVPLPGQTEWQDYQSGVLDWMQTYIAGHAADYTTQTGVVDFSNDPNYGGGFPGFNYWPSNLDENGQYDQFFALFTGKIFVSAADTYDFRYNADDGAVLLIDGQVYSGATELEAGTHDVQLYFYDFGGGAIIEFSAAASGGEYQLVGNTGAVGSGADFAIHDLYMYDRDAGDAGLQTSLSIEHGVLTVAAIHGATVTGSGTNTVIITGSQSQINDTLQEAGNVVYKSAVDFHGTDTLTFTTTDFGNSGIGGTQTTISTLDIQVDATPVLSVSQGENTTYTQNDAPLLITSGANLITDADNSQLLYASVKLSNAQSGDILSIIGDLPSGITATAYDATSGGLTLYGLSSLADYETALSHVAFSNSTNYPGSVDRVIEVSVNDGAVNSNVASLTINVIDTDDAPVANNDNLDSANTVFAGFTLNPDNGHWYKINTTSLSWNAAQAAAIAAGGYLATITSASENTFIDHLAQAAGGVSVWIGASDAAQEGHWVWTGGPESGQQFWQGLGIDDGGVALGYANWGGNEPNDSGGVEDAAHMQGGGVWNDANAGGNLASVIETSFFVEDRTSIISAASLLANDRDEGPLTVNSVDDSHTHGTVTVLQNGDVQYVPDANFHGVDSFAYTAIDAGGHVSNAATVTFTVQSVDDAPTAMDDHLVIASGNSVSVADQHYIVFPFEFLAANDDPDGGHTFASATDEDGPFSISQNGNTVGFGPAGVYYQLGDNQANSFTDSFEYRISNDGTGNATSAATVTLKVVDGASLEGGSGNDIIVGDLSSETLTGYAGADTFVFLPAPGNDTITDFTPGEDKIAIFNFNPNVPLQSSGMSQAEVDFLLHPTEDALTAWKALWTGVTDHSVTFALHYDGLGNPTDTVTVANAALSGGNSMINSIHVNDFIVHNSVAAG